MIEIKQFPKSRGLLNKFFRRNLEAFQKNIMKGAPIEEIEIPEITEEMTEQYAESMLTINPRILFDFFDEQKVHITIDYIYKEGFMANIVGTEYSSKKYINRGEAELESFQEAFKFLEEQL